MKNFSVLFLVALTATLFTISCGEDGGKSENGNAEKPDSTIDVTDSEQEKPDTNGECEGEAPNAFTTVGVCEGLKQVCVNGKWVEPTYSKIDGFESEEKSCDGLDNDCDGTVDEGCECTPGETKNCGSDEGECSFGKQTCSDDGKWGDCEGGKGPAEETCDGKDNDCNGKTDDGLTAPDSTTQEGVCKGAKQVCKGAEGWKDDFSAIDGYEETESKCDGKDNDCDGNIDNGLTAPASSKQAGVCENSVKVCDGANGWKDDFSSIDGYEADEAACDGKDNNCDGTVDEGCDCKTGDTQQCGTTDKGECKFGTQTCKADGTWGDCEGAVNPVDETCDGKDNDCDGTPDNNLTPILAVNQQGVCKDSVKVCENGQLREPVAAELGTDYEVTETRCDGKDNDCDGDIDKDLDAPALSKEKGVCAGKKKTCKGAEGWADDFSVVDDYETTEKTCDGLDNDCDGNVDNGLTIPDADNQKGVCAGAKQKCDGANGWKDDFSGIVEYEATESKCDGLDNDCDGEKDKNCACKEGDTQPCGTDEGACVAGTQTCRIDGTWSECVGEVKPTDETCDGLDNDCNGQIDEGLTGEPAPKQLGVCQNSKLVCKGEAGWKEDYSGIQDYEEVEHSCDNLDNDCDGNVDKDLFGEAASKTQGVCADSKKICVSGTWADPDFHTITGYQDVEKECDGLDNDCDGNVDNIAAEFIPQAAKHVGVCSDLVKVCDGANGWKEPDYATVIGADYQLEETSCDLKDNDCDGLEDENLKTEYYEDKDGDTFGNASVSKLACTQPENFVTDSTDCNDDEASINPNAQELCDNVDNNCVGGIDEGCDCIPEETQKCGTTDKGVCEFGTQTCTAEGKWGACIGSIEPTDEVCDGLDNNCDGDIDNGLTIPAATNQKGVCSGAKQICDGVNGWKDDFSGIAEYEATETKCDGLDNDCDGQKDVGCGCIKGATEKCGTDQGTCVAGTRTCKIDGTWGECVGEVKPTAETCDGLDNNCNGDIDEGIATNDYYLDEDGDTYGAGNAVKNCKAPTEKHVLTAGDCNDGDATIHPDAVEDCNGKDNNCDGTLDNVLTIPDASKQQGVCSGAKKKCMGTAGWVDDFSGIDDYETTETRCDGLDNDCDGKKDLECGCIKGATEKCGTDEGECVAGERTCKIDGTWGECVGEVKPVQETCDEKDNNCNGQIDEGVKTRFYRDADGDKHGTAAAPTAENSKEACSPPDGYVASNDDCNDGNININPDAPEVCDQAGEDENCSGGANEGCDCYIDEQADCGTDVGVCEFGKKTCDTTGHWGECVGGVNPTDEICDGKDNDCNDSVDDIADELATNQKGVCAGSLKVCEGGVLREPKPEEIDKFEATETLCDGLDNDCDDAVDESVTPKLAENQAGVCKDSMAVCENGAWRQPLDGEIAGFEATETKCDGIDSNCDGQIDENLTKSFYLDGDKDGFGAGAATVACEAPTEDPSKTYVENADDCDDASAEIKDAKTYYFDNDKDGQGDPNTTETVCVKSAGYVENATDCNDNNAAIYDGATEICGNNVLENCGNSAADEGCDTLCAAHDCGTFGTCGVNSASEAVCVCDDNFIKGTISGEKCNICDAGHTIAEVKADITNNTVKSGRYLVCDAVVTTDAFYDNKKVFLSGAAGGENNAIGVYNSTRDLGALKKGNKLIVTGTPDEYNGQSQLKTISYEVVDESVEVPVNVVTTADLAAGLEAFESSLVKVENVSVISTGTSNDFTIENDLKVDDGIYTYKQPETGTMYSSIQGIVMENNSSYTINPRIEADMTLKSFTIEWCGVIDPEQMSAEGGRPSNVVTALVKVPGITDITVNETVSSPYIKAEVGYGIAAADPSVDPSVWTWFSAAADVPASADGTDVFDQYKGKITAPAFVEGETNTYAFAYRFSADGGNTWTYCDTGILGDMGSKDGMDSMGVMTVTEPTIVMADNLFISEYVEGSGNNKAIEIFNGTGAEVDLSNYSLKLYANGATSPNMTLDLSNCVAGGKLENNKTIVIANTSASTELKAKADYLNNVAGFGGDDNIKLFEGNQAIDVFGNSTRKGDNFSVGGTANGATDHTLIRKSSVNKPNSSWAESSGTSAEDSEWIVKGIDDFSNLGTHSM